jgi:hypothetical protein
MRPRPTGNATHGYRDRMPKNIWTNILVKYFMNYCAVQMKGCVIAFNDHRVRPVPTTVGHSNELNNYISAKAPCTRKLPIKCGMTYYFKLNYVPKAKEDAVFIVT